MATNNTTISPESEILSSDILLFIKAYRVFENLTLEMGYEELKQALKNSDQHKISHLCDQWRWKKKQFGAFWLNSDAEVQIRLLQHWNFDVPGGDAYIDNVTDDPKSALFLPVPEMVGAFSNVLMYFENHGIDEHAANELNLPSLPTGSKQYGNSTNWGDFILSLNSQMQPQLSQVLTSIHDYYKGRRSQ